MNLVSGQTLLPTQNPPTNTDNGWLVRGDELQIAVTTTVPATQFQAGMLSDKSIAALPAGNGRDTLTIGRGLTLKPGGTTITGAALGIQPMDTTLESRLVIAVVTGSAKRSLDLTDWTVRPATSSLPAALWDPEQTDGSGPSQPDARLVEGCLTGIGSLQPPLGKLAKGLDKVVAPDDLGWDELPARPAKTIPTAQDNLVPAPPPEQRGAVLAANQAKRDAASSALADLGFAVPGS
jgi:hypothetical protein